MKLPHAVAALAAVAVGAVGTTFLAAATLADQYFLQRSLTDRQ